VFTHYCIVACLGSSRQPEACLFSTKAPKPTDDGVFLLRSVSEDEVTSEASDSAVDRERYVDDLHRALVEGEDRRRGGGGGGGGGGASGGGGRKTEKDNYSFHLTPDHSRLSYEKTCKGILVSNDTWDVIRGIL